MSHITTCTTCGKCYEEFSEEAANMQTRECSACWRAQTRKEVVNERQDILHFVCEDCGADCRVEECRCWRGA